MSQITFEDKVPLNNNSSIARRNKVTPEDMNEIKRVVNENADSVYIKREFVLEGSTTYNIDIPLSQFEIVTIVALREGTGCDVIIATTANYVTYQFDILSHSGVNQYITTITRSNRSQLQIKTSGTSKITVTILNRKLM